MAFSCELPSLSQFSLSAWNTTAQDTATPDRLFLSPDGQKEDVCAQQNRLRCISSGSEDSGVVFVFFVVLAFVH